MRSIAALAVAALWLLVAPEARGQGTGGGASWLEKKSEPSTVVAALSAGMGRLDDHDIHAGTDLVGVALGLDVGWRVIPNLAAVGHLELAITADDEDEFYHALATAGARYFPSRSLWVQATVGLGRYYVQYPSGFEILDLVGPAAQLGAGVVLARAGNFAFGLQARAAYASYDEGAITAFSLALDMSWD